MRTLKTRAAIVAALVTVALIIAGPAAASETTPSPNAAVTNQVNLGDDEIIVPGVTTGFGQKSATKQGTTAHTETTASATIEKVYVSVAAVTASTSDDVNTGMTESTARTLIGQLNSFWSAQSNGAVSIQLGGFETRALDDSSCAPTSVLSQEEGAAFGGRFDGNAWIGTHTHLLVLAQEACSSQSFATVGGNGGEIFSGNGMSTEMGMPYLLHEFGHNLGFLHADASICTNTTSYDSDIANFGFTSTTCPTREYDDYLDIMGYTVKNATPNLSSVQQILAGWLTDYATITESATTQTLTLSALGATTGIRAAKIIDPVSGEAYYVEYRAPQGRDATSAEFRYSRQCNPAQSGYTSCELDGDQTNGIVRVLRELPSSSQNASGTTVLANGLLSGSTDATRRHTHLNVGTAFSNFDDGFTVTVNSVSISKGASITVSFGAAPAKEASTIATRLHSKTIAKGSHGVVSVAVSAPGVSAPTGKLTIYVNGKKVKSYTLTASQHGKRTVTLPALSKGTKSITIRYSGTSAVTSATSTTMKAIAK